MSSSSEPSVPPILRSSTEEHLGQANEQRRTPISPEEHLRFQPLSMSASSSIRHGANFVGYSQSHEHDTLGHQYEHPGLNLSQLSSSSPAYSQQPFFPTSEAHSLHGSYSPAFGAPMFSPPMTSPSHPTIYSQHRPGAGEFGWSGLVSDRSASVADSDETYPGYAAQRAHSYPTIARRLSTPQSIPYSGADHGFPMNAEYQQQMLGRQYNDPSQYSNVSWMSQPNARTPHMPVSTASGFPQSWYATPLSFVREEEDPSHAALQSHSHQTFRPG